MDNDKEKLLWQDIYNNLFIKTIIFFLLAIMSTSSKQGFGQISDYFFQKAFLINNYNHLRIKIGDRVFSPNVLTEQNSWLEYTGGGNIDDYQNAISFSRINLREFNEQIKLVDQFGKKNNIEILIVIAPNKATIYPDKLPSQIKVISKKSRLDQVLESLSPQTNITFLDVRPALQIARQERDVYFQTDTHWNQFGAYIAYLEIIKILSKEHPLLSPYSQDTIDFTETQSTMGLANMIEATYLTEQKTVREKNPEFVKSIIISEPSNGYHETAWIPNSQAPSALVYHDSFGYFNLNDYLMLSFSKTNFIHFESTQYLNSKTVEYFQPDIIIIEIVERNLQNLPVILSLLISE